MKVTFRVTILIWGGIISVLLSVVNVPSEVKRKIIEQFSSESQFRQTIQGWKERSFMGNTQYQIVEENGNHILHAVSDSSASGLYKRYKYDPREWQRLSWRWKVIQMPEKGDERYKETDDYGARVYVIFSNLLWWKSKTISYIWASRLPKDTFCPNPWMPKHEMMVAVESGQDSLGQWIMESRNVYEDYRRLFGSEPPRIGAIAVLTDSDNTGGKAEAYYDDFILWEK